jgi:hypothetical protein
MIKVEHSGVREIARDWEKSGSRGTIYRKAMFAAGLHVRKVLRANLKQREPVGNVTGRLSRSVRVRLLDTARGPEADVKPRAFYAGVLELGRVIRAKKPGGRLVFPLAFAGASVVKGGMFRRSRKQMTRLATKAGVAPRAAHTKSVAGKHRKGDRYFADKQLHPFRTGVRKDFAAAMKSPAGRSVFGVGWVAPEQVTIPRFGFLARAGDDSAPGIAERLGAGYAAQLVRGRAA